MASFSPEMSEELDFALFDLARRQAMPPAAVARYALAVLARIQTISLSPHELPTTLAPWWQHLDS